MKKSPSERTRHVVAWMNKAEWDEVLDFLFSKDPQLQKHALHRISAWKVRFGHGTPVAVESTADLVRCQVLDRSGRLESDELVLLYGMALVRFVNLITERKQKGVARPLRRLLKIPEWIVNLRHELTHQRLPTLKSCREGCRFVLDWLLQEYWSRQLGSRLADDWDSQSEEEVDDEEWARRGEEELLARQKEIESHKKARELLVSYEREQRQTLEELVRQRAQHGLWPEPNTDLSWILAQIKHFAAESRSDTTLCVCMLVQDGFLIPTQEQLEFLDIDPSENFDPMAPCLPRVYLRLWQPLLKSLNFSFIHLLLEKLFAELAAKPGSHQGFYISAWIAEILLCNSTSSKARKTRMKDRIFTNRFPLRWQQLLTACTNAPCIATPYLLQLLEDMDKPLPPDTQRKLLRLCSIYTQGGCHDDDEDSLTDPDPAQPIYTVQSLKDGLLKGNTHSALRSPNHCCPPLAPPTQDLQEQLSAEALEERNFALHGSPWQVCTDKVNWKLYPLGQAPGQSGSPSCLMLENYSTLTIFDQQVELDKAPQHHNNSRSASDGLLWSHADLSKLKSGLKLF
uniref:Ribosomal biogenesis protein LAS1L n=1 Tax=Denticeps clupeoides TaxID=299321 RepID=A0AAY4EIS2_9TELE